MEAVREINHVQAGWATVSAVGMKEAGLKIYLSAAIISENPRSLEGWHVHH